MNREDFLKNVAGAVIAPTLLKDLLDVIDDKQVVIQKIDGKKRIAVDFKSISGFEGRNISPKDILRLYIETGVLIYKRTTDMPENYHPISIID